MYSTNEAFAWAYGYTYQQYLNDFAGDSKGVLCEAAYKLCMQMYEAQWLEDHKINPELTKAEIQSALA